MSSLSRRSLLLGATTSAAVLAALVPESATANTLFPGAALAGTAAAGSGAFAGTGPAKKEAILVIDAVAVRELGGYTPRVVGATITTVGTLQAQPGGLAIGSFYSTGTILETPQRHSNGHGTVETQVLNFDADSPEAGTLTGSGLVRHDGSGLFTITGGTGRFAGARGSYITRVYPNNGGHGTGTFTIDLS